MSDFRSQGERTFDRALQTKKFRAAMYREARQALDEGIAPKIRDIHIYQMCGYTIKGGLPDKCPICNAERKGFQSLPA